MYPEETHQGVAKTPVYEESLEWYGRYEDDSNLLSIITMNEPALQMPSVLRRSLERAFPGHIPVFFPMRGYEGGIKNEYDEQSVTATE